MTPPETITKPSSWPVVETAQRLQDAIAEHGMTVFAAIDQAAAARGVGLNLRPTVLILFGSPKGGTPVMDAVPLSALDLPLKLLVWSDTDTDTGSHVSYLSPPALAARWGLSDELAAPLAGIDGLADAVLEAGAQAG